VKKFGCNKVIGLLLMTLMATVVTAGQAFSEGPPPAKVVVAKIIIESVAENDSFLGLLYYDRVGNVSSDVAGLVVKIMVKEGDTVKAGDPLVKLDTELLDQELKTLRTQIEQLELRINHTKRNFARLERLYAQDGVSEKDFDDANYAYQDAQIVKMVAERGIETLLIKQRKSTINAPFGGVILEKNVDAGNWVSQSTKLVRIGAKDELFVRVPIAERLLRHVKVGTKVPVVITAYDKKVTGRVAAIDPTADAKTKNIYLKVRIPALSGVAENMSAYVHVPTSGKRKLAMIPRDALIKFQGKDFVYTVKEGKASILPVNIVTYLGGRIGADNPYFVAGMPIVIEGNERLRPDQAVVITPAKGK
jgi:membrane fusion protein (multidrug efflux system)